MRPIRKAAILPKDIQLPAVPPPVEKISWLELFKYPRSVAAGCLAGLSGTGITGFLLWQVTLFVMVLHITPAQASGLVIWLSLGQIVGRFFCSWISDAMGRRASIALTCAIASVAMSLAEYWHDLFLGTFSVFYLMIMVQQFFGSGSYSIIGPYMAEIWPSRLRASGMGLAYGAGNLGKFIGPAGLAVIAGSSNLVNPQATIDALIPGMNYFAVWSILGVVAALFIGFETRGRTIDEIDSTLTAKGPVTAPIKAPAV
jgi:MFS transporter, putative metabolite:H+ symporter